MGAALSIWDKEISRRHLLDFTCNTKPNFSAGWFHEKYYSKLNDFAHGRIKKLMVFVPPQHGKSEGSTRRLPAFAIGRNPNKKIAVISYSASKARKFNREIQRVIAEPAYKQIFPSINLSNGSDGYTKTFDEFEIVDYEGSIKTVGVVGPLTGDPVDMLILDDIYKDWASAQSDTIRQSIQDWYDSVAESRLHNDSQQLIVFTRWHEYDLAGYLLDKEPEEWEVIVYPAIKVEEPCEIDPRKPGEALWPEKHSLEKLRRTQKRNSHNFESLYQQNPKPKEGLLFAEDELSFYDPEKIDVFAKSEYRHGTVDPADDGGDDLAAPAGFLIGNKIYVPDIIYNSNGTDVNEPALVDFMLRLKLHSATIETNGGWGFFASKVREKVNEKNPDCEVRHIKQSTNKHTRILAASSFIKQNFVFRKDWKEHPQYQKFMLNLISYLKVQKGSAKNAHDDAPDALAEMAKYFQTNFAHLW